MVTDKEILLEINELKKKIKGKEKFENCLIHHQVNEIKNSQHNYLDTLARFLTSKKDICVAVYCHEHESTRELWITNNFRKAVYAEKCLEILCEFTNSNSAKETKENLEKLLWLAVEQELNKVKILALLI